MIKLNLIDMDTKEFIQGIITNELTGCFADCSQDNIDKLVDVLNRHHEHQDKHNEVLGDVSKPLEDLKRLVAEKTIEYITTEGRSLGRLKLRSEIEAAKESLEVLK